MDQPPWHFKPVNKHRISPAGTDTRDLSIRGLPFRVFGELGLKRRYAAVALPEALLDAGARAKTVTKAAKSGPVHCSLMTDYCSPASHFPARAPKEGAKRCKKVQKSAEKCRKVQNRAIQSDPMSFRANIIHEPRSRGRQSAHRRKSIKPGKEKAKSWSCINHSRQPSSLRSFVVRIPGSLFLAPGTAYRLPPAPSRRAPKEGDKTRQNMTKCDKIRRADRQERSGPGNPPACGRCRRISWADSPVRQEVSWSRGPVGLAVPMHSALSSQAPLSSPDSKWTGPFSTLFCCRGVPSRTHFPKAGYANTENSKWTKRINFRSILKSAALAIPPFCLWGWREQSLHETLPRRKRISVKKR